MFGFTTCLHCTFIDLSSQVYHKVTLSFMRHKLGKMILLYRCVDCSHSYRLSHHNSECLGPQSVWGTSCGASIAVVSLVAQSMSLLDLQDNLACMWIALLSVVYHFQMVYPPLPFSFFPLSLSAHSKELCSLMVLHYVSTHPPPSFCM